MTLIIKKEIKFIGYQTFLWIGFILYLILSICDHNRINNQISKDNLKEDEKKKLEETNFDDETIPLNKFD